MQSKYRNQSKQNQKRRVEQLRLGKGETAMKYQTFDKHF